MSVIKELLLSCIVMLHISFMDSRPVTSAPDHVINDLRKNIGSLWLVRCNLRKAEHDYVKDMSITKEELRSLERPEGITSGNTTEEIKASICAILDYLGKHLPTIINNVAIPWEDKPLNEHIVLKNTNKFLNHFKRAVDLSASRTTHCERNVTTSDDYTMKKLGYGIIYYTRQWVETFTNTSTSCIL